LWEFIDALKKEERLQRLSTTQLLLGQVVVRAKKTYRMTDEHVSNIVRDYANRIFTEFLRAIAHNLRF